MTDKQLAKSPPKSSIRDLLQSEEFKSQIAKALPKHGNAVRFARIALTATFRNPKLLECSRESLLNCLLRLSELGIEPDSRRAHLIPFGAECTLLLDYKGIAELARRNGNVTEIHCDVVGENDLFACSFGTNGRLDHQPKIGDRGKIIAAYSFIKFGDGTTEWDVMSTEEIETVRKRSRAANNGPWVSDWPEMAKKTVFRRHSKLLPLSPEVQEMIAADDELTERERFNAAQPVTQARVLPTAPLTSRPRKTQQADPERHFQPQEPPESAQGSVSDFAGNAEPPQSQNAPESSGEPNLDFGSQAAPEIPESEQTTLEQLFRRLSIAGYTETHLMELLRRVGVAPKQAVSLSQVHERKLVGVLADWDNCLQRLEEIKQGR